MKNITCFNEQIKYFWKIKTTKTLGRVYAYPRMYTQAQALRTQAKVPETMKDMFFAFKLGLERIPHRLGAGPNLFFPTI